MLRDAVIFRLRSAHAPAIHVASHADHEKKRCMVFYFYVIVMVLRLAARRAPILTAGSMINEPTSKV